MIGSSQYYNSLLADNIEGSFTFYVGGTGPGNYTSIQGAIDVAKNGDSIFIYNNIYYENINMEKSLDILGERKYSTIIDGGKLDHVLNLSAEWVNISNIMIKNGKVGDYNKSFSGCYMKDSESIFLKDIIISECELPVSIVTSNNISLQNCKIYDNIGGLNVYKSSNNVFSYCNISTTVIDGISFYRSTYNVVSNCNISNSGSGISFRVSSNNMIIKNIIYNNSAYGINIANVQTDDNKICEDNVVYSNNFIKNLINAHDGYNNSWDDGNQGNYWDDYSGIDIDDDGIGDTPYVFYGNTDLFPLINPVQLDFSEPEKSWLYLTILSPKDNSTVEGLVDIKGTASGSDDILGVKIKIDNGSWQEAIGTINWLFGWDTTQLEDDFYKITVLVNSTEGDYAVKNMYLQVNNKVVKENGDVDGTPGFEFILSIVAIFILFLFFRYKK
ncbi:MAG: right-handed parallel beta-helix repeat-containing protein [Thermoplasmatales archaeon]|nr:MAG: right-handed parallel beta-helix repeat-containing protein [Thermoplasmatales archaeon]